MASDTSDIPAGYFTTFSISDLDGLTPETLVRPQRRNRRVFVCIPCHRKKLKCNKEQPCSRCLAAGIPDACSYQPPATASNGTAKKTQKESRHGMKCESSPAASLDSPYSSSSHDPSSFRNTPGSKTTNDTSLGSCEDDEWDVPQPLVKPLKGVSHWTRIACEFEEAVPYLFGTSPQWHERYRQIQNLECLFASINDNTNFPFGSSFCSKDQILRSLPSSHVIDALVCNYLDTFGATHCLFHPSQLQYDLCAAASGDRMAEFCMVLRLGAETAPDYLFSGLAQSATEWAGTFMSAAQASFGRSAYMAAPSLATVRSLCMMVMAKLGEMTGSGGSPGDNGAYAPLVSLMALAVQSAKALQLHRSAAVAYSSMEQQHSIEAEVRRRMWVTVRLLDLETALRSGTTMQSDTGDAEPPHGYTTRDDILSFSTRCMQDVTCNEADCVCSGSLISVSPTLDYDGLYLSRLSSFIPVLASIVNTANSPTKPSPSPQQVAACSARVHKHLDDLKDVKNFHVGLDDGRSASQIHRLTVQLQHVEVVANRVLLALHHDAFCGSIPTQMSQSAVVESALALLRIQKHWATGAGAGAVAIGMDSPYSQLQPIQPAPSTRTTTWLLDLCHDSFAVAFVYMIVALRAMHDRDDSGSDSGGREAAETAVSGSHQILRGRSCRSSAQFHEYFSTAVVAACFRGLFSGDMLSEVMAMVNDVEQVVVAGRRDVLWADSYTSTPNEALLFSMPMYTL